MKNDKELIQSLRDYAKNYKTDYPCVFNPKLALVIANRMEQLVSLSENGASAIDTSLHLSAYIKTLQEQLIEELKELEIDENGDIKMLSLFETGFSAGLRAMINKIAQMLD